MSLFQANGVVRVLVADSSRIYTQLLANAIGKDKTIKVVAALGSSEELLPAFARATIDVAVISSNLYAEPSRTFEKVRELRRSMPEVALILLVDSSKPELIVDAFRTGVSGVFSTHESHKNLLKCIHCVHEGQVWAGHRELKSVLEAFAAVPVLRPQNANGTSLLSRRELQVVECVAEGLTNAEIGQRLGLSKHTIKNYLLRIFDKMGVSTRTELIYLTVKERPEPTIPNSDQRSAAMRLEVAKYYNIRRRDPIASYMWCLLAEQANLEIADQIRNFKHELGQSITPDQMRQAQEKAESSMTPPHPFSDHREADQKCSPIASD
jgi:DNA-binding NarL/FixJ family response regulator